MPTPHSCDIVFYNTKGKSLLIDVPFFDDEPKSNDDNDELHEAGMKPFHQVQDEFAELYKSAVIYF